MEEPYVKLVLLEKEGYTILWSDCAVVEALTVQEVIANLEGDHT
jgi:hypothetical protein